MKHYAVLAALALSACVSESAVYQRNVQPSYLSPQAKRLSAAERDQIARLLAHRTRQSIIGMCFARNPKYRGQLSVYTAYPDAKTRGDYGTFTLAKTSGQWHIIDAGEDLDPWMIVTMHDGL
jgi:hypothetical protein